MGPTSYQNRCGIVILSSIRNHQDIRSSETKVSKIEIIESVRFFQYLAVFKLEKIHCQEVILIKILYSKSQSKEVDLIL